MSEIIHEGKILASEPRAVRVRVPGEDQATPHSAIHGAIDILTDSVSDSRKILAAWPEIAHTLALKVEEILGRETPPAGDAPNNKESAEQ